MKLEEAVNLLREVPARGTYEVVVGPDNLNHLVVITDVSDFDPRKTEKRTILFTGACEALNGTHASKLEVASPLASITCLSCIQWRNV